MEVNINLETKIFKSKIATRCSSYLIIISFVGIYEFTFDKFWTYGCISSFLAGPASVYFFFSSLVLHKLLFVLGFY